MDPKLITLTGSFLSQTGSTYGYSG